MIKRILKYFLVTLSGLIVILLVSAYFVFNSNAFQNWITTRATSYLSSQFKTNISIGHIRYNPFTSFTLHDVYFGDQKEDTLFYIHSLKFKLGEVNADSLYFGLKNVYVEGALCKLVTYPDKTFNINVLFNILNPADSIHDPIAPRFHMYFDKVTCTQTRFRLIDSLAIREEKGFDGLYEDFYDIALKVRDFHIVEDSLNFRITDLKCREICGLEVKNISGNAVISPTAMSFSDMNIHTAHSTFSNNLDLNYESWDDMSDFNHKVLMTGSLKNSEIDMQEVALFAPALKELTQIYHAKGNFRGTVADFKVKNLELSYGSGSVLKGNVQFTGFPDMDETFIDARIDKAKTSAPDLEYITTVKMPEQLHQLGSMQFKGAYTGFINDFVAYGVFNTDAGIVHSDLNMKLGDSTRVASYSGRLQLVDFRLGKILNSEKYVGKTSLVTTVKGKGFDLKQLQVEFDTRVAYLEANGYSYTNITSSGELRNKVFKGNLKVDDPNAGIDFNGIIDYNEKIPLYKFKANLTGVHFKKLNLDTSDIILAANVDMNYALKDIDNNSGTLAINNINLTRGEKAYAIHVIEINSRMEGNNRNIKIHLDEMDLDIAGRMQLKYTGDVLYNVGAEIFPGYLHHRVLPLDAFEDFKLSCSIRNPDVITELFFPNIQMKEIQLTARVNSIENFFTVEATGEEFKYGNFTLNGVALKSGCDATKGDFAFTIDEITQNDTLVLKRISLDAHAAQNKLIANLSVKDSVDNINSHISAIATFESDQITATFDSSYIAFRSLPFYIASSSRIVYDQKQAHFYGLNFFNHTQSLSVNGYLDVEGQHNLRADINNLDLSAINSLYRKLTIAIEGKGNGQFILKGNNHINFIDGYLNVDNLVLDNDTIGNFSINSNFNEKQKRFLVYIKSVAGKLKNMEFGGYVETSQFPYKVNMDMAFDESPLNSFQAFFKDQLLIYEGTVMAKGKITGDVNHIALSGKIELNKVKARIEYLKTIYHFDADIHFDKNEITLLPAILKDENGKTGTLYGSIYHHSFSDFKFDLGLRDLDKFHLLNTTSKDNDLYYGTGFASGIFTLTGPIKDLVLDARIKTEEGTLFNIPLDKSGIEGSDIIHFVDMDTTGVRVNTTKETKLYGFSMNILLDVTPDAEIQIVFDQRTDDKLRGNGNGTLKMELSRQGVFNMYGSVDISGGDYKFTVMNVFPKKFTLMKGGSISWAGDPMQANIDIHGVYKVRSTSIAELLPTANLTTQEIDQIKQNRVPVECLLNIKGTLKAPEINFDLNFPDLSTGAIGNNYSSFQSSLRTLRSNPDLMSREVASLLISGSFISMTGLQQSNGGNVSNIASNTLSDLISAQANNIAYKYAPGFQFNVDIRADINRVTSGSPTQQQQAILSASRKFFNQRLDVQGSYDIYNSSNNNFMTQYNLTKEGNLRLRAYNKTTAADPTTSVYVRSVTTQGFGLYYRKEFDTFMEIFKKKQSTKGNN